MRISDWCSVVCSSDLRVVAQSPGEIVVTGQGLPAGLGDLAYDIKVIDRAALGASASGRLEDVLRDAAGFHQFRRSDSRSAHPTSQGATLRGLGGNASARALVLLDGVPVRTEEHTSEPQALM